MALSLKKQIERARDRYDDSFSAVFKTDATGSKRFQSALADAPEDVRAKFHACRTALNDAEQAAIDDGKAYRGTFNMLTWYK